MVIVICVGGNCYRPCFSFGALFSVRKSRPELSGVDLAAFWTIFCGSDIKLRAKD